MKVKGKFELTPSCTVYPTRLRDYSFALVTSAQSRVARGRVLHVCASSQEEQSAWVRAIQATIAESSPVRIIYYYANRLYTCTCR